MAQPYPIISIGAVAIEKQREARQLLLHLIPQHTCLTYLMALKQSVAVICLTSVKSDVLTDRYIKSIHYQKQHTLAAMQCSKCACLRKK